MSTQSDGIGTIYDVSPHSEAAAAPAPPRAIGALRLSSKRRGPASVIDRFRTSGAIKALFPRGPRMEATLINTSGGLTGGDKIRVEATAGAGSALTLTTQAAERAYRSAGGHAQVTTRLTVEAVAALSWLPQETILYDGCALRRSLHADLAEDARLLLVEALVFGRAAMGERLTHGAFHDDILIRRAGRPLYLDRTRLSGDVKARLSRPAVAGGAGAATCLLYVAPDAEAHLDAIRAALPSTGGASLLAADVLVLRLVAADGFGLRRHLLPILDRLSRNTLPKSWRL